MSYELHSCLSLEVCAHDAVCAFGHLMSNLRSDVETILQLYMNGKFFLEFFFNFWQSKQVCLKLSTVGAEQSPVLRAGDPMSISDPQGGAPSSRVAVKEAPSPTSAWGRSPVFCSRKPVLGGHTFVRPWATHPGLGHHCPARARTGQAGEGTPP